MNYSVATRKTAQDAEAKPEDGSRHKIATAEERAGDYAPPNLKWVENKEPPPFVYESAEIITHFTDGRIQAGLARSFYRWLNGSPNPNLSARVWMAFQL